MEEYIRGSLLVKVLVLSSGHSNSVKYFPKSINLNFFVCKVIIYIMIMFTSCGLL